MAGEDIGLRLGELLQQQQQHQQEQQQQVVEVPQQPQRRRFNDRLAGIVTSSDGPSTVAPFVQKLYELLNDPASRPFAEWSSRHAGHAFVVWDPVKFAATVLPRYFKHSNFCSFVRQLNIYGFHKLPSDAGCVFQHELFRENAPFLLTKIQRRRPRRRVLVPVPPETAPGDESPPALPSPALSYSSSTSSAVTVAACEQEPVSPGEHPPEQQQQQQEEDGTATAAALHCTTDEAEAEAPLLKREETESTRAAVGAVAADAPAESEGQPPKEPKQEHGTTAVAEGKGADMYDVLVGEIAQLQRQTSEMHKALADLQDAVVQSRSREELLEMRLQIMLNFLTVVAQKLFAGTAAASSSSPPTPDAALLSSSLAALTACLNPQQPRSSPRMSERPRAEPAPPANTDDVGAAVAALQRCLLALAQRLEDAKHTSSSSSSSDGDESAAEEGPNPLVLLGRLEKLQHDTLPQLRARCERVVALKRELVAATRAALLPARAQLIDLQLAAGVPLLATRGPFEDLAAVLAAWDRAGLPQPGLPQPGPPQPGAPQPAPARKRARLSDRHGERQLEMIAAAEGTATATTAHNGRSTTGDGVAGGPPVRTSERFVPVGEAEFAAVSTVVRGRCRLEDVNALYEQLFVLRQQPPPHGVRRWPATVAELAARGVRVAGLSGEQKLATLRALGIVAPAKTGVALVDGVQQPPPPP